MMAATNLDHTNGRSHILGADSELRRSNRRVGLLVAAVAFFLVAFTILYVAFLGGSNVSEGLPLHSLCLTIGRGGRA